MGHCKRITEAVRTRSVRTVARPSRAEQLSAEAEQRAAGLESRQLNSARIAAALLKRGEQRANSALSQRESQQPLEPRGKGELIPLIAALI